MSIQPFRQQHYLRLAFVALVLVLPIVSSCGKKEIEKLTAERDALQSKLTSLETERDKLTQASNSLASTKEKEIQNLQLELSKASNAFHLERSGLLLTNNFLSNEIERLRSDLKTQQGLVAQEQKRQQESKKLEPIKNGLKALRKLQGATSVGMNQHDYSSLLIEQQGAIDDAVSACNGPLAVAIKTAEEAYQRVFRKSFCEFAFC